MQTWFDFDQDIIGATIDQWHDRLRSCVHAGGDHLNACTEVTHQNNL